MEIVKILADGVNSVAVHNGVARIEFMTIGVDGKAKTCLELQVPMMQIKQVAEAFKKAAG